ncbi:hypothetical protein [Streptomyces sp. NPDC058964]|uniref:hypothetical protein n=1 Tax=Streptomyces sp. NPDC058964 TaxID=3346681 RepID=UPI0036B6F70D
MHVQDGARPVELLRTRRRTRPFALTRPWFVPSSAMYDCCASLAGAKSAEVTTITTGAAAAAAATARRHDE